MFFHKLIIFQIITISIASLVISSLTNDTISIGIYSLILLLTLLCQLVKIIKLKLTFQFFLGTLLFENAQYTEIRIAQLHSFLSWIYMSYILLSSNFYFQVPTILHILLSMIVKTIISFSGYDYFFYLSMVCIAIYSITAAIYEYSQFTKPSQQEMDLECNSPHAKDFIQIPTNRTLFSKNLEVQVLDHIPVGIVILSGNHDFQFMNNIAIKLLEVSTGLQINEDNVVEIIKRLLRKSINSKIQSLGCLQKPSLSRINQLLSKFSKQTVASLPYLEDNFIQQIDPINSILQQYSELIPHSQQQIDNKYRINYKLNGKKKCFRFHFRKHHQQIYITMLDETSKIVKKDQKSQFVFQHQLLNSFSHELKTPLNCAQQLLEVLISKIDEENVTSIIKPIKQQNDLLLCQINDILDYASFQIDDFCHNYQQFYLEDLLQDCNEIYTLACAEKKINIKQIQTTNVKHLITNDYQRAKQVIVNLLNNSIKFTSQHGTIALNIEEEQNGLFLISVIDSGLGLSNEQLTRIQDSLEQDIQHTDYSQFHVGLGLKVANKLVKGFSSLQKGLKITSIFNKGTIISFYIQDVLNESSQMSDTVVQSMLLSRQLSQLTTRTREYKFIQSLVCKCNKILIVDDIPFNHHALKMILKDLNQQADSAYDGTSAVDLVTNRSLNNKCHPFYQLILMDIEMPLLNGFEASIRIKQHLGENKDQTAIIMCSAYDNQECIRMSRKCHMIDVLPKPINRSNLQNILEKYLK